ncbi:DnaJ domain-containing protein [Pseudoalteromonas shioyasakiensis]|uniref:DNA-J related domain-containing protein n=1 Tax=Pseudoalteromonas shioyasakiensis TaxID=1190813 RepID=UPI002117D463|nr:DNA-J related domain-containing protein [Pseudoalteromonas shioyasakiensis]MCQ8879594.1 DnaJ domain-containing protein [Pseudoalteromonas shioyasakiensis]
MLNPLIDVIFELILTKRVWKVHTLALELTNRGIITTLDDDPHRDLFKRNFLIMNALYQLQQQLAADQHLQIASLHIELCNASTTKQLIQPDPLRDYYLAWQNYDTSKEQITALLNDFWHAFATSKNSTIVLNQQARSKLLKQWQLTENATLKAIQKRWRQFALQYHPDKSAEDGEVFNRIRQEYEQLKNSCSAME